MYSMFVIISHPVNENKYNTVFKLDHSSGCATQLVDGLVTMYSMLCFNCLDTQVKMSSYVLIHVSLKCAASTKYHQRGFLMCVIPRRVYLSSKIAKLKNNDVMIWSSEQSSNCLSWINRNIIIFHMVLILMD